LPRGSEGIAAARALAPPPAGSLRYTVQLMPLGIPTRFEADAPELLAAARTAYGETRADAPPAHDSGGQGSLVLRVVLLSGTQRAEAPASDTHPALRVDADRELLLLAAPDALGRASRAERTALARLTPALLAAPERLRAVLDALVLYLLTPLDRQPVHAAAVAHGAAGLALAGRGGAGKSTLAYAAQRAGLDVLTDDAVYVQLEPALHVWTLRRPLHLAPETAKWFPELASLPTTLRANGKQRIAVPMRSPARSSPAVPPPPPGWRGGVEGTPPPSPPPAVYAVRCWGLCLLERAPGVAPAAIPIAADEAVARVVADLEPGFDVWRDTIGARVAALARGGAWRLRVGDDPRAAAPIIRELLDRLARSTPR